MITLRYKLSLTFYRSPAEQRFTHEGDFSRPNLAPSSGLGQPSIASTVSISCAIPLCVSQHSAELQIAGPGEKRVTLMFTLRLRIFYRELNYTCTCTKLSESGGFELLRVPERGKKLDVTAAPETVTYCNLGIFQHLDFF